MVIAEPQSPGTHAPSDGTCPSPAHATGWTVSLVGCDSKYNFLGWKKERFPS